MYVFIERLVFLMENMIDFILNGSNEFTPESMLRLIIFVLVMECIGSVAYSLTSVGRRQ